MRCLVLIVAVTGCTRAPKATPVVPSDREAARSVLERHCGVCHREDSPRANPKALAVFNLNEPEWAARMSGAQMRDVVGRLVSLSTMKDNQFAQDTAVFGGPPGRDDAVVVARYLGVDGGL